MHRVLQALHDAARGAFPPSDGVTEVVGAPPGYRGMCLSFTAHSIVAADVGEDDVRAALALHPDPYAAAMAPAFQCWLTERVGAPSGVLDVVFTAMGTGAGPGRLIRDDDHASSRVANARRLRSAVEVWRDPPTGGVVVFGTGVAGRRDVSYELDDDARGNGAGRALIAAALGLVPSGEPVFAQVSPGNARSLRTTIAAGFVPLGSEVLFGAEPAESGPERPGDLTGRVQ